MLLTPRVLVRLPFALLAQDHLPTSVGSGLRGSEYKNGLVDIVVVCSTASFDEIVYVVCRTYRVTGDDLYRGGTDIYPIPFGSSNNDRAGIRCRREKPTRIESLVANESLHCTY